jgi:hypothetical protein
LKFSRKAMEIRVLDTQECVKMDIAIAVFVRSVLRHLTRRILAGVRFGSRAQVVAPILGEEVIRADDGTMMARDALRLLLDMSRKSVRKGEEEYLDLVSLIIESGSLSERMRAAFRPEVGAGPVSMETVRGVYLELADCLEANEPWFGRGAAVQRQPTTIP